MRSTTEVSLPCLDNHCKAGAHPRHSLLQATLFHQKRIGVISWRTSRPSTTHRHTADISTLFPHTERTSRPSQKEENKATFPRHRVSDRKARIRVLLGRDKGRRSRMAVRRRRGAMRKGRAVCDRDEQSLGAGMERRSSLYEFVRRRSSGLRVCT